MQIASALLLLSLLGTSTAADPALSTYRSDALHFSFTYPADLKGGSIEQETMAKARDEASGAVKQAFDCISTPLMAIGQGERLAMVMLIQVNLECLKVPVTSDILTPLAQNSLSQGLGKLGKTTIGATTPYKLDGHDAVFIRGSAAGDAGTSRGFGGVSCALIEKSAVCWALIGPDAARVNALAANQVTFDGHAAQPIVPADVAGM